MGEQIPVLILGSYHMRNAQTNVFNPDVDDVLGARRQAEMADLVERLVRFRPTQVAVEVERHREEALNQAYRLAQAGERDLEATEVQQIGFRVAMAAGLPGVHAVDDTLTEEAFGPRDLGEIFEWAGVHDPERHRALVVEGGGGFLREFNARQRAHTIPQILRWFNDPAYAARDHGQYLLTAELGDPAGTVGMPWVLGWYHRNLQIYLNIVRLATPGARIFVVYGAGHLALLRHFFESSPRFVLEDPTRYLPGLPPLPDA
jgi:hypothetical protein